jgi:hypothetical protein
MGFSQTFADCVVMNKTVLGQYLRISNTAQKVGTKTKIVKSLTFMLLCLLCLVARNSGDANDND